MPPGVWLTPNLRNAYVGVRSDSGVRTPDVHLVPTYTFHVDAVGKEAALALLRVCVLYLQRRGSQTVFGKVFNGFLDRGQLLFGVLHHGRITV